MARDEELKLTGWTGDAAVNFRGNYLGKFNGYTDNLYTAAYIAYQTTAATAKLWKKVDEDIHDICDEAQRTVDAMLVGCLAEGFSFALTILGSVVEVGSAAKGEAGLTIIKEVLTQAQETTIESGSAKTPVGLMEPLKKAIDRLKSDVKRKEQEIKDATGLSGRVRPPEGSRLAAELEEFNREADRWAGEVESPDGCVRVSTVGMRQFVVEVDPEAKRTHGVETFCDHAARAGSALVRERVAAMFRQRMEYQRRENDERVLGLR